MSEQRDEQAIELIDLGDATEETRQLIAIPVFFDSVLGLGLMPDL